jgi:hypothetical protein
MNREAEIIHEINKDIVLIKLYVEPATCSSYASSGDDYNECDRPPIYLEVAKTNLTDKVIDISELKLPGYEQRVEYYEKVIKDYKDIVDKRLVDAEKLRLENNELSRQKTELELYIKDNELFSVIKDFEDKKYKYVVIRRQYAIIPDIEEITDYNINSFKLVPQLKVVNNRNKISYEVIKSNESGDVFDLCATLEEAKSKSEICLLENFKKYCNNKCQPYSEEKLKNVASYIKKNDIQNEEILAILKEAKATYIEQETKQAKRDMERAINRYSNINEEHIFGGSEDE